MVPGRIVDANADEPAEQKSYSSRSIKSRSERIEYKAWHSIDRSSFSGGIEGRPSGEYRAANSGSRATSASFTISRIARSG